VAKVKQDGVLFHNQFALTYPKRESPRKSAIPAKIISLFARPRVNWKVRRVVLL